MDNDNDSDKQVNPNLDNDIGSDEQVNAMSTPLSQERHTVLSLSVIGRFAGLP